MAIIPTVRCSSMKRALQFYTAVLDFQRVDEDDDLTDPCFTILQREGETLLLSSHSGDGVFGQAVVVTTDDVDALFRRLRERGLSTPGDPEAPTLVHEGPIDQTWGTRESSTSTTRTATPSGLHRSDRLVRYEADRPRKA